LIFMVDAFNSAKSGLNHGIETPKNTMRCCCLNWLMA